MAFKYVCMAIEHKRHFRDAYSSFNHQVKDSKKVLRELNDHHPQTHVHVLKALF